MDIKILHLKTNAQNLDMWIAYDLDNNAIGHIFMLIEK